ncbi:MAG TPA: ATP-binding protein, partial [Noviherbaspirillum sp.]|nr:ATP-binding protein [Noviherbaspirillum sp.]
MKAVWQSMTSRVFLVLFAGMVITALLTAAVAMQERKRMISQFRDYHAVERVTQFIVSLDTIPPELREAFYSATAGSGMRAAPASVDDAVLPDSTSLAQQLAQRLPEDYEVDSAAPLPGECAGTPGRPRRNADGRAPCEVLLVGLPDGEQMRLSVFTPRPPSFVPRFDPSSAILLFLASIGVLAALVARMTMRPLKRLADAANELGKNIDRPPLPETGAREIRQASAAFNAMQARIRQHVRQRTQILAAITHDLQTPLTRLRLRLEKVEDVELRDKLIADLSATQVMVREGLDLARSMDNGEPLRQLDLDSLVDSICTDAADAGQDVRFEGGSGASVLARPAALRRCLENLIGNAVKYGLHAAVSVRSDGARAIVCVRDAGPGIPDEELEKVFEPFYRLEDSR